jgi:hypothetical protein
MLDYDILAEKIVNDMSEELFISSSATFVDISFAGGQLLRAVARRLRRYGHSIENIQSRLFGFEDNIVYINHANNKSTKLIAQLRVMSYEDILSMAMQFDAVISNPPFNITEGDGGVSGTIGDKTLYRKFTKKAFDLCKPGGTVAFITLKNVIKTLNELGKQIDTVDYMTENDYWKYNTLYFIGRNIDKETDYVIPNPIISKIIGQNEFNVQTQPASLMQNKRSKMVLGQGDSVLVKLNGLTPEEYSDIADMSKAALGPKFAFTMLESKKSYTVTDAPMLAGCVRYVSASSLPDAAKIKLFVENNKAFRYFTDKMKGKSHAGMLSDIKKFDLSQITTGLEYPVEWNLTAEEIKTIEDYADTDN